MRVKIRSFSIQVSFCSMGLPDRPYASPFSPIYSRRLFCLGGPEQAAIKATNISHRSASRKRQVRNSQGIGWAGGHHCLAGGTSTAVNGRKRPLWLRLMPAVGLVVFDSWRKGKGEERPFQFVSLPAVGGRCRLVGESRGNGRFGFSHCQRWPMVAW